MECDSLASKESLFTICGVGIKRLIKSAMYYSPKVVESYM